jgi:hypothetical protein
MRRFGFSSSHFFSVPVLLALCHAMAGPVGRGDGTLSLLAGYRGLAGTMTYRSFHAAATWTFSEGERTLRRVRYREPPEGQRDRAKMRFIAGGGFVTATLSSTH